MHLIVRPSHDHSSGLVQQRENGQRPEIPTLHSAHQTLHAYRITELLRLEKTLKIIKSNHKPNTAKSNRVSTAQKFFLLITT